MGVLYIYVIFIHFFCSHHYLMILGIKNESQEFERLSITHPNHLSSIRQEWICYMGVSKNRDTPKWMVYNGKPYWNGLFWGENPLFSQTSISFAEEVEDKEAKDFISQPTLQRKLSHLPRSTPPPPKHPPDVPSCINRLHAGVQHPRVLWIRWSLPLSFLDPWNLSS